MKTNLIIICCLIFCNLNSQIINFSDINFKNKLLLADEFQQTAFDSNGTYLKIDINNDGQISQYEASRIENLNLSFSSISDLTGINYFNNLISLNLYYNNLNNLNISNLIHLKFLSFILNNLTTLDLTGLNALERVALNSNNFTSLDVSQLPNLKELQCSNNQITTLDFSNNPQFKELVCNNNNLTSINIKNGSFQNINLPFPQSFNDCWKIGNPNLTYICADANEIAPLTTFLTSCNSGANPTIDSSCVLASEQFVKSEFLVYPNPTNSIINFNFKNNGNDNIQLLDIQGRVLQSQNVSNSQTSLDISALVKGVYFLKLNAGNRTQIEKILKE